MLIREVTSEDWQQIWPFMQRIVKAGDTFTWDPDTSEEQARGIWLKQPPGRTVVAVDDGGAVLGTAETNPNQGGPGSHVANASFMVDQPGRGVGRALVEHVLAEAAADGYRAIVFNAVAATNTHAVHLYESLGFEVLATIPGGFAHPRQGYVGLHVMHRRLVN